MTRDLVQEIRGSPVIREFSASVQIAIIRTKKVGSFRIFSLQNRDDLRVTANGVLAINIAIVVKYRTDEMYARLRGRIRFRAVANRRIISTLEGDNIWRCRKYSHLRVTAAGNPRLKRRPGISVQVPRETRIVMRLRGIARGPIILPFVGCPVTH